jgi:hypothetical protein
MANKRTGNTLYIDSTGVALTTTGKNLLVTHIVYSAGSAGVSVDILDGSSRKLLLALSADNTSLSIDLSKNPMSFRTSININSITSGLLMLVFKEG